MVRFLKPNPIVTLLSTLHLIFFAAYIFFFKILPLQEYPDWLYQGWVFKEMVFNGATFDGYFTFHHTLPPNAFSTIIIGTLSQFFHPVTAGNIFLLLCLIVFYTGAVRFMEMYTREFTLSSTATSVLIHCSAFLLAFNINFFLGNNNFILGLGIALHSCVLLRKHRWEKSIFKSALLFFFCYITHFLGFVVFLYFLAAYFFIEKNLLKDFSFKNLFNNPAFKNVFFAFLPVLAILVHYALHKNAESPPYSLEPGIWNAIKPRITLLPKVLGPLPRFKGIGSDMPAKVFNYAVVGLYFAAVILILVSVRRNFLKNNPAIQTLIFLVIITPLIVVLLPPTFQGILYPGERFVVLWASTIIILFIISRPKLIAGAALSFLVFNLIFSVYLWQKTLHFQEISRREIPVLSKDSPGLIDGFTRLVYYDAIERKTKMPIFFSGLLKFDTRIPYRDFSKPPGTLDSSGVK